MESEACEEPDAPGLPRAPAALKRGDRPWREARDAGHVFAAPTCCGCHTVLPPLSPVIVRVNLTDRSDQTDAVRYRYIGPVWPETGPNRLNSNLNSKAQCNRFGTAYR